MNQWSDIPQNVGSLLRSSKLEILIPNNLLIKQKNKNLKNNNNNII